MDVVDARALAADVVLPRLVVDRVEKSRVGVPIAPGNVNVPPPPLQLLPVGQQPLGTQSRPLAQLAPSEQQW